MENRKIKNKKNKIIFSRKKSMSCARYELRSKIKGCWWSTGIPGIPPSLWGIGAPIEMLLEPDFPGSGRGSSRGRCEKSLRGDDETIRIANICATSKTAVETDRFARVHFLLLGSGRPGIRPGPGPDPGRFLADLLQLMLRPLVH